MKKSAYKCELHFYEKTLAKTYDSDPSTYIKESSNIDDIKKYDELIWQAIEIEQYDNTEVFVFAHFERDGEYLDRDEFVIKTHIVRTKEPSKYIKWGNKTPHIFTIDREQSKIEIIST